MRGAGAQLIATGQAHQHLLTLLDNDMVDNRTGSPETETPEGGYK
jgi:hypothetical protein